MRSSTSDKSSIPLYQVDAFTAEPFGGNPAAVCLLDGIKDDDDDWMQKVAAEMNLSETAFLIPFDSCYKLRWFTPAMEVDLCGHATLASAHVLWEQNLLNPEETARFETHSGQLTATRQEDGWIELNFPATPAETVQSKAVPEALLKALGIQKPVHVAKSKFDYLIEVETEEEVKSMSPDFSLLRTVDTRGVIVTSIGQNKFDFVSRFFAPAAGIDEDPVTGSAHCCLVPYWATKLNKMDFTALQASARGAVVRASLEGARVTIAGQAITVLSGELVI